jgi:hypothetical protein
MRTYSGVSRNIEAFNEFFWTHLLPVQVKHGASLVGRWQTEDDRVVAVWAYANRDEYLRIADAVRGDRLAAKAREVLATLPRLFERVEETFMVSTLPR